jgi:adenosine deaminase
MQDENSIYRVTMEALEDLSDDGVVYAELRFAPLVHCQKGLTPIEVVDSVVNGIKDGMEKYNIVSGVILCGMRQEDNSQEVVDLCIEHKDVIGFDLAGPEIGFSVLNHKDACQKAYENNINVTLHADWEVPEGIQEVVLNSKAKRVGHGSQIINDIEIDNEKLKFKNDAAKYVYENKIALELCPTSNIQCGAYQSVGEHSFGTLYKNGFNVTINTDNRLMSDISMSEEVNNVVEAFNLNENDIRSITKNTIEAGFVNYDLRKKLME